MISMPASSSAVIGRSLNQAQRKIAPSVTCAKAGTLSNNLSKHDSASSDFCVHAGHGLYDFWSGYDYACAKRWQTQFRQTHTENNIVMPVQSNVLVDYIWEGLSVGIIDNQRDASSLRTLHQYHGRFVVNRDRLDT